MNEQYQGKWQASHMVCLECEFEWAAVHPAVAEYLCCPNCFHLNPSPYINEETGEVIW